eukprot:c28343_g1_i1 orf=1-189(-)
MFLKNILFKHVPHSQISFCTFQIPLAMTWESSYIHLVCSIDLTAISLDGPLSCPSYPCSPRFS